MNSNSMIMYIKKMINEAKTSINNNVNTVYSKVNSAQTDINSKISGVKTDTSSIISSLGNSTYGLSAIKNAFGNGSVKVISSIQRGEVTMSRDKSSITATISPVITSKSIVLFSIRHDYRMGGETNLGNIFTYTNFTGTITNSSTLTFERGSSMSENNNECNVYISWQVIEFN